MIDKYTVTKVKQDLAAYKGSDTFLTANAALLLALPDDEAAPVLRRTAALANSVLNMGTLMAFEVVVKQARNMAAQADRAVREEDRGIAEQTHLRRLESENAELRAALVTLQEVCDGLHLLIADLEAERVVVPKLGILDKGRIPQL